ncbi:hypothetical protein HPP92_018323 [Vanilla planifolia]|uniref:Uncharacterized protein n=1 Tax=Vanilla planifolia TaxID=51239 RepID=A0A835Q9L0_VANPL|nr:hypothetical protein HPP92_018323 [Vanilla planifolia]
MELRRRLPHFPSSSPSDIPGRLSSPAPRCPSPDAASNSRIQASDALPLPIRYTNLLFSLLFVASSFFLMRRWREKVLKSIPLHAVDLSELLSIVSAAASLIYLLSFFGIAFVQSVVSSNDDEVEEFFSVSSPPPVSDNKVIASPAPVAEPASLVLPECNDEEIIASVVCGKTPSYSL